LYVKLTECAVRLQRNTGEGEEDAHALRKISQALGPTESVHIAHTEACAGGAPSPCHGEIGPGSHPPVEWRYYAWLYGDRVYPWLEPVLSAVGSAVTLRPLIDPLRPELDAAALQLVNEQANRQDAETK
jgi:hypothetical protein